MLKIGDLVKWGFQHENAMRLPDDYNDNSLAIGVIINKQTMFSYDKLFVYCVKWNDNPNIYSYYEKELKKIK